MYLPRKSALTADPCPSRAKRQNGRCRSCDRDVSHVHIADQLHVQIAGARVHIIQNQIEHELWVRGVRGALPNHLNKKREAGVMTCKKPSAVIARGGLIRIDRLYVIERHIVWMPNTELIL